MKTYKTIVLVLAYMLIAGSQYRNFPNTCYQGQRYYYGIIHLPDYFNRIL